MIRPHKDSDGRWTGHGLVRLVLGFLVLGPGGLPAQPVPPELPELPDISWSFPGDMDGDGYRSDRFRRGTDCNDQDASIYPGAEERCDGVDQDCDGEIDEDAGTIFYPDADGDGWGVSGPGEPLCTPVPGFSEVAGDCDDGDRATHPGALELMDAQDQNCNGYVDETAVMPVAELERVVSAAPRVLGDVNGDGFDDFVVGGNPASLFLGGPGLAEDLDSNGWTARFDTTVCGGQSGTFMPVGDLNGDGYDDFGYLCRPGSSHEAAFLNLYAGRPVFADFDLSQITSRLVAQGEDQVITTVAGWTGDLNGDGYDDLLLGLPDESSREAGGGRVVLHFGGETWWPLDTAAMDGDVAITGWAGQHLGQAVENVGDLDHDGQDEIAVIDGPEGGRQRIYLFKAFGDSGEDYTSDDAAAVLYSSTHDSGLWISFAGDLSGDGVDDLVMGDGYTLFMALSEGDAWYLEGFMAPFEAVGEVQYLLAMEDPEWVHTLAFRSGGDINGDGQDDLLLGAWGGHTTEAVAYGAVSVILGVPTIVEASSWPSPSGAAGMCTTEYCLLGSTGSFDGGGDFDGDGFSDFLVGGLTDSTGVVFGY